MTRGQVAKLLGIHSETLRYYEKIQLIEPEINIETGYRYYDDLLVSRLTLIVKFKNLGFTLNEIKTFFELIYISTDDPKRFTKYIDVKSNEIDKKVEDLLSIKSSLLKFRDKKDKETCSLFSKFIKNELTL